MRIAPNCNAGGGTAYIQATECGLPEPHSEPAHRVCDVKSIPPRDWKVKGDAEKRPNIPLLPLDKDIKVRGVASLYEQLTYDMGQVMQVEKRHPGNYGAPGVKRAPKRKRTPEDMARQNMRNRVKRVQRLILANFRVGGWHLILTYKKHLRPDTLDDGKGYVRKFLGKMRKAYQKAGYPFKYICVTEKGKRGACHHHLIIEDIANADLNTKEVVMKFWKCGRMTFLPLYAEGEFEDLAEYITKKETKEEGKGCSYTRSRNLIVPKPKKEIIHRKTWRKDPRPKKGYYIIPDSVINGINPVTGYPYQHYAMRKYAPEEELNECR